MIAVERGLVSGRSDGFRAGPWTIEARGLSGAWTTMAEGVGEAHIDAVVSEYRSGEWYSYRIVPRAVRSRRAS